ncbi:MAG TPA: hypothetical protein VEZ55_06950 [Chitinophagaceae bacterium]|nr:hypothetical protein [Chitinophagaceae bacterium]
MITSSELIQVVYDGLKGSLLEQAVSGKIYKRRRPKNSNLEDVVINSLPTVNGQLQQAVLNVNVFVPDLQLSIGGEKQNLPDEKRLNELEVLAVSVLKEGSAEDSQKRFIQFEVQQTNILEDDESDQYFINIRLQFFITNIN